MSDIRKVTIHITATGNLKVRKYAVEYTTGVKRTYGIPPDKVEQFIRDNSREFTKVKYCFKAG